jgi:hypothetical protein
MKVVKTTAGGYQLQIVDDPGLIRSDLALYYGELVQGYRIIVFGDGWANVEHVVGRNRERLQGRVSDDQGQAVPARDLGLRAHRDGRRHGRRAGPERPQPARPSGCDPEREARQEHCNWNSHGVPCTASGLGRVRRLPGRIDDGAIDTDGSARASGRPTPARGRPRTSASKALSSPFMPREDATAPDADLIPSRPISTQPEWQLGWGTAVVNLSIGVTA